MSGGLGCSRDSADDAVKAVSAHVLAGLDPVYLFRALGNEPDPWQSQVLRSPAKQVLLNCARQTGKSTVVAVAALHEALYRPPALVLLLSPGERQSGELFRKVMDTYHALAIEKPPLVLESIFRAEFANGSRILALPGREDTVRGYSGVRLLLIDEASRVADDLYESVRPMLAVSGGRLMLLSTPYGKRGFFYHEWRDGGPEWERIQIRAADCPRMTPEFLAREMAQGARYYQQEFGCEFVETDDQYFRDEDIRAAFDPAILPLFAEDGSLSDPAIRPLFAEDGSLLA